MKIAEVREIGLSGIAILPERLRALQPETVKQLASSMRKQGLLQPIVLRPAPGIGNGYFLIAGLHRYYAAKKLGWKHIAARIFHDWGDAEAQLAEIDENLIRADLTAAQRAKFTAARKKAYLAAHPQTKRGGAAGKAGGGKVAKADKLSSFAEDTAAKTGRTSRDVRRDVARAEALGDDIDRVAGTSLDKGIELDALAAMPADARQDVINRAAAGEKVSAKRSAPLKSRRSVIKQAAEPAYPRGKDAVRTRVLEAVNILAGGPTASEVASYFRGHDSGILVRERLPRSAAWMRKFASLMQPKDLPLNEQVNRLVGKLSDFVDDYCEEVKTFIAEHPEIDRDGRDCIAQFLLVCGNRIMSLEQTIDGRDGDADAED